MTDETLAGYANVSLYSAMAVFTIAMLCYAVYLAGLLPARDRAGAREAEAAVDRDRELVAAGAPAGEAESAASATHAGRPGRPGKPDESDVPSRARAAAGIGATTTWLGGMLLLVSVVLRGLSVERWPLGNMFEFAVMGSMFEL